MMGHQKRPRALSARMASPASNTIQLLARSGDVGDLKRYLSETPDDCRGVDKHGQSTLHISLLPSFLALRRPSAPQLLPCW
jgi:hypothetical protein